MFNAFATDLPAIIKLTAASKLQNLRMEPLNIKSSTVHAIKSKSVRIKDIVDKKRTVENWAGSVISHRVSPNFSTHAITQNGKLKIVIPDCLVRRSKNLNSISRAQRRVTEN
ncbi:hypothetical protein C1H46_011382 [Malus baccata]|uniref:Uncharacterized protein n=1 Tax=Malus baccata TaxID=106549 RepID=A0A540MW71_MALBA|nr:hypothetical protein C1H46_011382 [Malus baccata]